MEWVHLGKISQRSKKIPKKFLKNFRNQIIAVVIQRNKQKKNMYTIQFNSVQSLSRVWLFATPWIATRQASLSISGSSLKLTSIELVMPSSHLILCCPLLLLPPIPPSIRVFSNESTLRMRWTSSPCSNKGTVAPGHMDHPGPCFCAIPRVCSDGPCCPKCHIVYYHWLGLIAKGMRGWLWTHVSQLFNPS